MGFFSRVMQYFLLKEKSRQKTSEPSPVRENKALLTDRHSCLYALQRVRLV